MSYKDAEGWVECPFRWPVSGWRSDVRVAPGVDLILMWSWCKMTGYSRCVLVDRGHGGRPFSLAARPVLLNGVAVMAARKCLIYVGYAAVTALGYRGVWERNDSGEVTNLTLPMRRMQVLREKS